ncbi:MAG: methyltransferase [Gorillibacterium sp.]|nr:methyltransferase [Gorillibacterium sp.]
MERLYFLKQYITKPKTVGAILPSSKHLAHKMMESIDFNQARYIVEFGPGTGVFTEKLLKNRKEDTVILLFENNEKFYDLLKEKFKHEENLHIIKDSAEYLDKYLVQYNIPMVDYIVSGLPFASLSRNISANILTISRKYLKEDGKFITFQYTLLKKELVQKYFGQIRIQREFRNIPPAYVFCCSGQNTIM